MFDPSPYPKRYHRLLNRPRSLSVRGFEGYPYLVLHLDLARAFVTIQSDASPQALEAALNCYLNSRFHDLLFHNRDLLSPPQNTSAYVYEGRADITFRMVMVSETICITTYDLIGPQNLVAAAECKVLLFIDNFNSPLIHSTPGNVVKIMDLLDSYIVYPVERYLGDQDIVGGLIVGRPVEEEPVWSRCEETRPELFLPISVNISDEPEVHGAFGLSLDEVAAFAEVASANVQEQEDFVAAVKTDCLTYAAGERVEYFMRDVAIRFRRCIGEESRPSSPILCLTSDDEDED